MKIQALTVSMGRELYLKRMLNSLEIKDIDYEHTIIFQKELPSVELMDFIKNLKFYDKIKIEIFEKKILSIGEILNYFKSKINCDIFFKIDDDALIRSNNLFEHIIELNNIVGPAVYSPYPVGLINNPGGVLSKNHFVAYSEEQDVYYTLRKVSHVGGFCRFTPGSHMKNINFTDSHNEDGECSSYFNSNGIPMFYLENNLIVEHQESTLGQHQRYGQNYFGKRF